MCVPADIAGLVNNLYLTEYRKNNAFPGYRKRAMARFPPYRFRIHTNKFKKKKKIRVFDCRRKMIRDDFLPPAVKCSRKTGQKTLFYTRPNKIRVCIYTVFYFFYRLSAVIVTAVVGGCFDITKPFCDSSESRSPRGECLKMK